MNYYFKTILGLSLLMFFAACQSDSNVKDHKDSNLETAKTVVEKNDKIGTHLHLVGTIKDIPITMELSMKKSLNSDDSLYRNGYFEGFYYYEKYLEPIQVFQYIDSSDHIILSERYAYEDENQFIGQLDSAGNFSGTWKDGYRGTTFPFELINKTKEQIIQFKHLSFNDVLEVPMDLPEKPSVSYDLYAIWPTNLQGDKGTFLKKELLKIMSNDSLGGLVSSPKESFAAEKQQLFDEFQKYTSDMNDDYSDYNHWGYQTDMSVFWNSDDLLCVAVTDYEYTGGAHGNYGTTYHCYDMNAQQKLTESDVFKADFEGALTKSLLKSAQRTFDSDINDYTPMDAINVEALVPNGNFFITGGGVGYNFTPYEVAAYAVGEIRLFIPKEELLEVVKDEFKERMGW